jgi:hypothetical protein
MSAEHGPNPEEIEGTQAPSQGEQAVPDLEAVRAAKREEDDRIRAERHDELLNRANELYGEKDAA